MQRRLLVPRHCLHPQSRRRDPRRLGAARHQRPRPRRHLPLHQHAARAELPPRAGCRLCRLGRKPRRPRARARAGRRLHVHDQRHALARSPRLLARDERAILRAPRAPLPRAAGRRPERRSARAAREDSEPAHLRRHGGPLPQRPHLLLHPRRRRLRRPQLPPGNLHPQRHLGRVPRPAQQLLRLLLQRRRRLRHRRRRPHLVHRQRYGNLPKRHIPFPPTTPINKQATQTTAAPSASTPPPRSSTRPPTASTRPAAW